MDCIHLTDLEAAINHWRERAPAGPGCALAPQTAALAQVYARMICERSHRIAPSQMGRAALHAWLQWYETQPDTPCIAVCSTSQGDAVCKGCGRSFAEVQHWLALNPYEKRAVWQRITAEATAWRFTRYAERALEGARGSKI